MLRWVLPGLLVILAGCFPPPRTGSFPPGGESFPVLRDEGNIEPLKRAVDSSLLALSSLHSEEIVCFAGNRPVRLRDLVSTLSSFRSLLDQARGMRDVYPVLKERFHLYEIPGPVVFTGYYEPVLEGSLVPSGRFRYPLYRCPEELKEAQRPPGSSPVPAPLFYTRKEIDEEGVLAGRGLELLYLDDPVERFFLQIEGAGMIRLPGNRLIRVQYDGSNGRPYTSIGRVLIEEGKLSPEEATLPGIQAYLRRHAGERTRILNRNERYIFFKISNRPSQGVLDMVLTPYRSLATDPRFLPAGSLLFYRTSFPELDERGKVIGWKESGRFAVSQDIGKAIEGPRRADIFVGVGERAAFLAGRLKSKGKLFLLLSQ